MWYTTSQSPRLAVSPGHTTPPTLFLRPPSLRRGCASGTSFPHIPSLPLAEFTHVFYILFIFPLNPPPLLLCPPLSVRASSRSRPHAASTSSVPSTSAPSTSFASNPRPDKNSDYYANVGDAIRTLRDDLPRMFHRPPDFSIYREDIVFRDPNVALHGIEKYKTLFWSLRFHGRLFFNNIHLEVRRIWQSGDDKISMRWTIKGVPKVFGLTGNAEPSHFDGISHYTLDSEGKIYEHKVDFVVFRDPPMVFSIPLFENLLARDQIPQGSAPIPFFTDGKEQRVQIPIPVRIEEDEGRRRQG